MGFAALSPSYALRTTHNARLCTATQTSSFAEAGFLIVGLGGPILGVKAEPHHVVE